MNREKEIGEIKRDRTERERSHTERESREKETREIPKLVNKRKHR